MTDQQVQDKLVGKVAVNTVVTPGPGAINWRDIGKGALYAIGASVLPLIMQMINSWTFDFKSLAQNASYAFTGYLLVKFFSSTQQITTFKKN